MPRRLGKFWDRSEYDRGAKDKVNRWIDFNEVKMIWKDKNRRKPYLVAILLAVLYVGDIFFLSSILGRYLGIAGTVVHEVILAGMGVVVFLIFKGKLKIIFPVVEACRYSCAMAWDISSYSAYNVNCDFFLSE